MDYKLVRLSIAATASVIILVLVIVAFTNQSKINELLGRGSQNNGAAILASQDTAVSAAGNEKSGQYGRQIGDDLDAFLADQSFFDEEEKIPSVVVIKRSGSTQTPGSSDNSSSDGSLGNLPSDASTRETTSDKAGGTVETGLLTRPDEGSSGSSGASTSDASNAASSSSAASASSITPANGASMQNPPAPGSAPAGSSMPDAKPGSEPPKDPNAATAASKS